MVRIRGGRTVLTLAEKWVGQVGACRWLVYR